MGRALSNFRGYTGPTQNTSSAPQRSGYDPSGFSYTTQPRDTSKPSFLSSMGGGNKPSGPNIVVKPRPSTPQPSYNFNRGQVGGISSIPSYAKQPYYTNLEAVRNQYFDNRPDVSRDRLFRRSEQDRLLENFRNTQMKDVVGATGLKQSIMPGGPTTADEAMRLANIYGPTPGEIYSDVKYGMGQFGKAIAERGTPLMNLIKDIYGGVQNFFSPAGGQGTTAQDPLAGLTPGQISSYNQLVALGMDPQVALTQVRQQYASGGIARLN